MNDSEQHTVCKGHEKSLHGSWGHPELSAASGSGLLGIGVTKCPSEPPRLQASFLHPKVAGEHCFEVNFA